MLYNEKNSCINGLNILYKTIMTLNLKLIFLTLIVFYMQFFQFIFSCVALNILNELSFKIKKHIFKTYLSNINKIPTK